MSGAEDGAEKSFEPSQRKLEQAREKGEIAKSSDLTVAGVYAGILIAAWTLGGWSMLRLGALLESLIERPEALSRLMAEGGGRPVLGTLLALVGLASLPWFALPALGALASEIAQRGIALAPGKIAPKLDRISPLAQAKNKFGRHGLFEFAKSAVKLMIVSVVLGFFLAARLDDLIVMHKLEPRLAATAMMALVPDFVTIVLVVALGIGVVDAVWQQAEHRRKNMMTRQEMLDEGKESEGDPHMKAERRAKGQAIAMNKMMADVPRADVVIVNPTHYAVALRWSRAKGEAPVCVAKGVDEVAARIRAVAMEAGVPVRSDPPTARALHAGVEIGQMIPHDQYRAVAAAIRFADAMRRKARAR